MATPSSNKTLPLSPPLPTNEERLAKRKLLLQEIINNRPPEPLVHDFPLELAQAMGWMPKDQDEVLKDG